MYEYYGISGQEEDMEYFKNPILKIAIENAVKCYWIPKMIILLRFSIWVMLLR